MILALVMMALMQLALAELSVTSVRGGTASPLQAGQLLRITYRKPRLTTSLKFLMSAAANKRDEIEYELYVKNQLIEDDDPDVPIVDLHATHITPNTENGVMQWQVQVMPNTVGRPLGGKVKICLRAGRYSDTRKKDVVVELECSGSFIVGGSRNFAGLSFHVLSSVDPRTGEYLHALMVPDHGESSWYRVSYQLVEHPLVSDVKLKFGSNKRFQMLLFMVPGQRYALQPANFNRNIGAVYRIDVSPEHQPQLVWSSENFVKPGVMLRQQVHVEPGDIWAQREGWNGDSYEKGTVNYEPDQHIYALCNAMDACRPVTELQFLPRDVLEMDSRTLYQLIEQSAEAIAAAGR